MLPLKQSTHLCKAQSSGGICSDYFHSQVTHLKMQILGRERPGWPNWTIGLSLAHCALTENPRGKSEEKERMLIGENKACAQLLGSDRTLRTDA